MNVDKTNCIAFSTNPNRKKLEIDIVIQNKKVKQIKSTKFLGIIISENLSWDLHIQSILTRISSGIYALRRMSGLCNVDTLKTIYFSLIQSHIAYGIVIYGATTKNNMDKILRAQKKAIRIMLRLKWSDTVRGCFVDLGIMTVYSYYIYQTILFYKEIYCPSKTIQSVHAHDTRNYNYKITERPNIEIFKKNQVMLVCNF